MVDKGHWDGGMKSDIIESGDLDTGQLSELLVTSLHRIVHASDSVLSLGICFRAIRNTT
jgi:hypothetical protein